MPTPEESARRIAQLFTSGAWKVKLEPEEVNNWHDIDNLLMQAGFRHVNMSGTTSKMIKPYAINVAHRKDFIKLVSRFLKRLFFSRGVPQAQTHGER